MFDSLYTLTKSKSDTKSGVFSYHLSLNKDHEIFKGHFPDFPILPGVCQIAIITELLEKETETTLALVNAGNIKFLKMINPEIIKDLNIVTTILERSGDFIRIASRIEDEDSVYLKLKGQFKVQK